jgi:glycosyltransferase involved in cell wall biosynthesis
LGNYWETIFGIDLMAGKKLVVISHTAHQYLPDGTLVGWGPTVAELNYLSQYWDELLHVACIEPHTNNQSLQSYQSKNIRFAPIPSFGGTTWLQKLGVFYKAPQIIWQIVKSLKGATHVQIRVPMGIGVYVLPLFIFIPRKFILWVKYANNWGHVSNSLGYRFQRWFLEKNFLKCKVTINGFWSNQPQHCHSFENPCITQEQFEKGKTIQKSFDYKLKVVFAGRIEEAKGIDLLMEVLKDLPQERFEEWVFIGEGPLRGLLMKLCFELGINAIFPGFLSQSEVHKHLETADILVLPSKSEGFPKIVAEAWNYKAINVVSPVGSLPHYLEIGQNGFMMEEVSKGGLLQAFKDLLNCSSAELKEISGKGHSTAYKFTFDNYYQHLQKGVFS